MCRRTTFFSAKICQMASSSCSGEVARLSSLNSSMAACRARSGHTPPGRLCDDEQAAPVVAGPVEQLGRHGHGRKLREVGGPAGELAAALDEDGAVAVDEMLRLFFPGRLMQGYPDACGSAGFRGELLSPAKAMPVKVLNMAGTQPPSGRRDGPDDVGRPPPVAAVEDGEQVGAAVAR